MSLTLNLSTFASAFLNSKSCRGGICLPVSQFETDERLTSTPAICRRAVNSSWLSPSSSRRCLIQFRRICERLFIERLFLVSFSHKFYQLVDNFMTVKLELLWVSQSNGGMMNRFKKRLSSQLPPTPCSAEMRARMSSIAESEGRSLADVQRDAFSLFLSKYDRKTRKFASRTVETRLPNLNVKGAIDNARTE